MYDYVLTKVEKYNPKVVIFDIDGTLKDLCKEHDQALLETLNTNNVFGIRRKVVFFVNRIAMAIVKAGISPTNKFKQKLLVIIYAIFSFCNIKKFIKDYYINYSNKLCVFDGMTEFLNKVSKKCIVYFSTVNRQNYNLEECGITQEQIIYSNGSLKVSTYKNLLKSIAVKKERVLIVGDNIFDDFISAKLIGVKCLLINNYNSKFKQVICKTLKDKHIK